MWSRISARVRLTPERTLANTSVTCALLNPQARRPKSLIRATSGNPLEPPSVSASTSRGLRRGGDDVVGRGELYGTLRMLIQNREILQMCIAIFDSARQREHREQLRERGALVLT
jgi:hypothetical protein